MGCKLEAFILNHQAAEMLPDKGTLLLSAAVSG
jgi:hypothetical protein